MEYEGRKQLRQISVIIHDLDLVDKNLMYVHGDSFFSNQKNRHWYSVYVL